MVHIRQAFCNINVASRPTSNTRNVWSCLPWGQVGYYHLGFQD